MSKFIGSIFLMCLSACALNQPREFDPDLCVKSAAYEVGYNDGRKPWGEMRSEFLNRCREDLRDEARVNYRDGYNKGHDEMVKSQEEARKAQQSQPTPYDDGPGLVNTGTQINVNFGAGGSVATPQKWFCKVEAFMKTFEGMGVTQFEARREAVKNCTAQYHEMHCNNPQCELVR